MEGAKVYVKDEAASWRKATVVAASGGGKYRVQLEPWEGEDVPAGAFPKEVEVDASALDGGALPFQNAGMPDGGYPDMTLLDHLHEAALLHNLRVCFLAGVCPYTYTADIVIATNPYKWLPELYTDEKRKEYVVFERSKLSPHVYATSSAAYSDLQESKTDQSILVSGESGAGKTETVKILMGHLALIASSEDTTVIRRIVESNPLLEAFGNAQTVRNDNSSRFGKFIELELDGHCRLVGSKCRTFLLEKSRVVGQDEGERNYHIFYQMLAADAESRASFCLGGESCHRDKMRYTRLGRSKIDAIEGRTDGESFKATVAALGLVGIDGDKLSHLLRALAGVLLVGELTFASGINEATQDATSHFGPDALENATAAATALEVEVEALERALTQKTLKARDESIVKRLPPEGALATCEALAKELYTRVFDWLVARICAATSATDSARHCIGLLDIFGFESFAINRFEQLCINYANEKLQQKFTLDIFKAVQQEYADEGIPWDRVEFKDNAPVVALIEAKLGIIAMLNEECVRPKGSDENYVSKLVSVHRSDPAFSTPRVGAQKEVQFSVRHYAGSVTYTTTGWLERNKDIVSDDLLEMLRASKNPLVAEVFAPQEDASAAADAKGGAKSAASTVATKFKASLAQLMEAITQTRTQYVRCIKPNKLKSATQMENLMVVEQLRCAGVIEAIRISRAGFPARMPLAEFTQRFAVLQRSYVDDRGRLRMQGADGAGRGSAGGCQALLVALMPGKKDEYEIGRTRVYFKAGALEAIEERRAILRQVAATALARRERGRQASKRFRVARLAALRLQTLLRMRRGRAAYLRTLACITRCQARRRRVLAQRRVAELRRQRCATRLQSFWRGRLDLRRFARVRAATLRLQAVARRNACRRRYLVNLAEFKEQAKLENQVKALQARLAAAQQEAAAAAGAAAAGAAAGGSSAAPAELLEALQHLTAENSKLREELERTRSDNTALRRENQELRASQSTRTLWLNFLRSSPAPAAAAASTAKGGKAMAPTASEERRGAALGGKEIELQEKEPSAPPRGSLALPPQAALREPLRLYTPLSEFWGDLPCSELPMLQSRSEVHFKFGANLLVAEPGIKHLTWRPWMQSPVGHGYPRSMAFELEPRALLAGQRPSAGFSISEDPVPEGCLGHTFALRSVCSGQYVCGGGLLTGYCMQVSAERPEDASIFSLVPRRGDGGQPARRGSVESHFFALQLPKENKLLSLRGDGYVSMTAVTDGESGIVDGSMMTCIECLLPCTSYEITVFEKQIGLIVGKELPLRVVGFRASVAEGGAKEGEPGPAERTGRVHIGDMITHVNGRSLDGVPRAEALAAIAERRPVTLGFAVDIMAAA
eukprot:TRINITY_DN5679_c0_g1_i1.p1 TRINITY_DN5679_c0_g1~~TRINITY_DN5679_c0_g1_i1.p1  ORF type:complete len:1355 (-),score=315.87 TRINITY_DN5679_c0_g1_i1:87-4151(-)